MAIIKTVFGLGRKDAGGEPQALSDLQQVNLFVLPFLLLSLGLVWIHFGLSGNAGVALLWALCCLTAGAAIGFLFGIPRSGAASPKGSAGKGAGMAAGKAAAAPTEAAPGSAESGLRPNTNLEEVSDWLTKIIVGLGLVNLGEIGPGLQKIAKLTAAGWSGLPEAQALSLASALIVAFAVTGFLAAYVYTRLFLQEAFGRADQQLDISHRIERAQAALTQAPASASAPVTVSAQELKVAQQIMQNAKLDDLPAMTHKLRSLAREYEQMRQVTESGPQRTQAMATLVQKMRTLALASLPALAEFARSEHAGERLAAVAMLQTRYDASYTPWLAQRLVDERPFVAFNAASALLAASKNLAGEPLRKLLDEVQAARTKLAELGLKEAGRDGLIERILQAV